jgi:hypothetical protein
MPPQLIPDGIMVPSGYWIALVHRNLPDLTARHLKECFHGGPCQTLDQCRGEVSYMLITTCEDTTSPETERYYLTLNIHLRPHLGDFVKTSSQEKSFETNVGRWSCKMNKGIAACFSTRTMWGLWKKHLKKILSRFCSQGVPNYNRVKVFQI